MCVLQAKPIGVEEDSQQGELIVASGVSAGEHVARNNLQTLLRRALVVSTELGKMFQRLEKGRWQRVHSTAVRANCHVRSLVHEYSAARSTPPEMQKVMIDFGFAHTHRNKKQCVHFSATVFESLYSTSLMSHFCCL